MADLHAAILARLDELDAVARSAMTYTSGNWTVVPGGSMVDIDCTDIQVDGGGVVQPGTWDSIIHTGSDPFVAEHIVAFRPPVVLGITGAIRAVLAEHEHVPENGGERTDHDFGCRTCHNDSHCGTIDGHGWCDTMRRIAKSLGIEVNDDD